MSRIVSTAKLVLFAAIFGAMIFVGCNNSSSDDEPNGGGNTTVPDDSGTGGGTTNPDDSGEGDVGDTDVSDGKTFDVTVSYENCNASIYADGKFVLPQAEVDEEGNDKDIAKIYLNFDGLFDASGYEKLTFDVDASKHNESGATFVLLGEGDWNPVISQWGGVGVWSEEGKYNYVVDLSKLDEGKTKNDLKTLKTIRIEATSKYEFTVYDNFTFEGNGGTTTLKIKSSD